MNIRPIRCETDYDAALEMIDSLMGAAPDTPEGNWLDVLVTLVESYEARRWPVEAPDPVAMIEHAMEARGYRQKDLAAVIGSQPHASEVLSRRRPLTLPMIRALSAEWKIPADVLVREYALAPEMTKRIIADFETAWRRIVKCAGQEFHTKRGIPFSYWIDGNTLQPEHTVWHISKRNFEQAHELVPFDGPGFLQGSGIVGQSYVWAILHDPRIRYTHP